MGPKKKKTDKKNKKKGTTSSPNHRNWSSEFDILLTVRHVRFFKWTISNFPDVNSQCVFSDYFDLGRFRFRFLLFPQGQESRNNTNKYLSFHLERAEGNSNHRSCFVGSRITVVNHEDKSNSVENSIFHRFLSKDRSHGKIDQFMGLGSLHDPQSGFMLNGTDLHIRGSVTILIENQVSKPREIASTSDGVGESSQCIYSGQFQWTITNYSFFEEAVMMKKLKSDPVKIGETCYRIKVGCCTEKATEGDVKKFSVYLEHYPERDQFSDEADNTPWFAVRFYLWSRNDLERVNSKEEFGRIMQRWTALANMSDITGEDNTQSFDFYKNYLRISLTFYVLKEKDFFHSHITNMKNVWNFGEGSKATSTAKKKYAERAFTYFSWEITNFLWIPTLTKRSQLPTSKAEILSKTINHGQVGFRMKLCPFGCHTFEDRVTAFLAFFVPAEKDITILVHYRFEVQNQKWPEKTRKVENIQRLGNGELIHGHPLIPTSIFYEDSAGYLVEGKAKFGTYIHVVKELMDIIIEETTMIVAWKLENFLVWDAIRGHKFIPSQYFEHNNCLLRIEVGVSNDGVLCGTLSSDPSQVEAGIVYQLLFHLAMINHKSPTLTVWEEMSYFTNTMKISQMGDLSEILREGAGFVVNDTIIFNCEIVECSKVKRDFSSTLPSSVKEDQVIPREPC